MHSAPADRFTVHTQTDELSFRIPMERVAPGPIPKNPFHLDPKRYLVSFEASPTLIRPFEWPYPLSHLPLVLWT